MGTSPHTSAQQYLIRAREQSHWNRRASEAPASSERSLSRRRKPGDLREEAIWQKLRAPDLPIRQKDADSWRTGSAIAEAHMLYKLLGRNGDSAESLRRLISVTPTEEIELRDWAACSSPRVAVGIDAMLHYRQEVLRHFDRLVASSQ